MVFNSVDFLVFFPIVVLIYFLVKKKWGMKRELPKFAKESFSEYWKNINKLN